MKFKFSLKNRELGFDADVERLIEKQIDHKHERLEQRSFTMKEKKSKKTRFQIKQEEKRKTKELEFEQQQLDKLREFERKKQGYIMLGLFFVFLLIVCLIGSFIEKL